MRCGGASPARQESDRIRVIRSAAFVMTRSGRLALCEPLLPDSLTALKDVEGWQGKLPSECACFAICAVALVDRDCR